MFASTSWAHASDDLNVLFIAVDDLRVELGCYGDKHVHSPNLDRLASEGMLFERAYCQQTVCNPSRASTLTGLRPDTLRVWDLPTHFRSIRPQTTTLPEWFKQHGYHAQCIGKIFHNWRQDDWKGDPVSWSVPSQLHYNSHNQDLPLVKGALPPNHASGQLRAECRDVPDEAYFDGRVAQRAIETIHDLHESGEPFFLGVGFWKPHLPFNAPKRYWDQYDPSLIPLPPTQPPKSVPEIALTDARFRGDRDALRELHHGHLAAISYVDAQIGRVLDCLDACGIRDETIVVVFSDHGLHLGEHGLLRKTTVFELDARVPLIVAAPNYSAGRTESLVELVDLLPTLVELASLPMPTGLEGTSLVPLLRDPSARVKAESITQIPRPNYPRGKTPEVMGYSMRTPHERYTEWRRFENGEVLARELYDHRTDPQEQWNVAGDPDQEGRLAELKSRLQPHLPSSWPNPGAARPSGRSVSSPGQEH